MICVLGEGNPDNVTAWPPELERELRGLAKVVSNEALLARLRLRNEYRQYNRTKQIGFGPWHQVYQAEFDGMRKKRVIVKIIGG